MTTVRTVSSKRESGGGAAQIFIVRMIYTPTLNPSESYQTEVFELFGSDAESRLRTLKPSELQMCLEV